MAPMPAAPAGPDFSSLERHLLKITSQIEALQRPDHVEQSIAAFRSELAEIRQAITEAVPRREIELLENEIRSLSRRIDDNRQNGSDGQALAGIERALGEIREVLRSLTPAEQLTGYDEAIRNLGAKLDLILRSNDDPSTVQQLESAIAALRGIVSNVASNDALARLADDVHTLSAKVDQLSRFDGNSDAFGMLEQRLAALTSTLETRQPPAASDTFGISRKRVAHAVGTARPHPGRQRQCVGVCPSRTARVLSAGAPGSLRDRSAAPAVDLGRVEEGLHDILRSLERQHASLVALADFNNRNSADTAQPMDSGIVDLVKRELSDIRFSQSETDRRTQDLLETVHSTLGHVVDRLSTIEGDLRTVRTAPAAPAPQLVSAAARSRARNRRARRTPLQTWPQQSKPELPNPAALQAGPQEHFAAAPREFHAAQPAAAAAAAIPPRAISEILEPHRRRAARRDRAGIAAGSSARAGHAAAGAHVFAVGTDRGFRKRDQRNRCRAEGAGQFVELHCRRAPRRAGRRRRAAPEKAGRSAKAAPRPRAATRPRPTTRRRPSNMSSKIRSLLVGASVVVIVLGTFKMAMTLLDTGSVLQLPMMENSSEPAAPAQAPAPTNSAKPRDARRPRRRP